MEKLKKLHESYVCKEAENIRSNVLKNSADKILKVLKDWSSKNNINFNKEFINLIKFFPN